MFSSTKLRQVVGVDRAGSFSGASKSLHVSQSTLTKAVADVETSLGYALFFRTARGVVATPEGREFLNRAARIVADFDLLIEDTKSQRQNANQRLRVGISPATIEGLFNRTAAELVSQRPEISLTLLGIPIERGLRLLTRGDIDVLCGPLMSLDRDKELTVEAIMTLSMQVFCRKGHPILKIKDPSFTDMKRYKLVTSDLFELFSSQIEQLHLHKAEDPRNYMHIVNNFPIAMEIVARTDALSVVSRDYARSRTFQKRFDLIPVDIFEPMTFGMAHLSRWIPSRAVRTFREILSQSVQSSYS